MSKAENFILEHTRKCSNEIIRNNNDSFTNIPRKGEYCPWLTPDQARMAVEIAREEIYEWLRVNLCDYFDAPREDYDMCLDDLKQGKMSKNEKENRIHSFALEFLERQQIVPNLYADQIIRGYKEGYYQAEKDLELTVEDIKNIDMLLNQCVDYSNPYQEVLNRFNKQIR